MSRAMVEHDFFGMEKETSSKSQFQKLFDRRRSFRDIQSAISKINPELVKTVIASGSVAHNSNGKSMENGGFPAPKKSFSVPSTPKGDQNLFPSLPVYTPIFRPTSESPPEIAPLTIFYNGTVSVFNVPRDKAGNIMKLALDGRFKMVESADPKVAASSRDQQQLIETLDGDLPIARRKSLQRFLEKRKERLTTVSPYACHAEYAFWGQKTTDDLFRA